MNQKIFEVGIIGGGIAGASVAAFLAEDGVECALFEMENTLAYHTTGRSAALYTPHYGPDSMRAFARVAKDFFLNPPYDVPSPLTSEKGAVSIVDEEQAKFVERPPGTVWWDEAKCIAEIPILRSGKFIGGVYEEAVRDIDVHALHSLYVRIAKQNKCQFFQDSMVQAVTRKSEFWTLHTKSGDYQVRKFVNAAGAWGDRVGALAGVKPIGLTPKRRTVAIINQDQLPGIDFDHWPTVIVEPDYVYFQRFGKGFMMLSPVDKTPSEPCDAQPEELDIATGVYNFEQVTTIKVRKIERTWAGLRTFAPDGDPVIGWAQEAENYFWLVGQGGYGVFTSPGVGRYAASLISGSTLSSDFQETGYDFIKLTPDRFQ